MHSRRVRALRNIMNIWEQRGNSAFLSGIPIARKDLWHDLQYYEDARARTRGEGVLSEALAADGAEEKSAREYGHIPEMPKGKTTVQFSHFRAAHTSRARAPMG